jgi:hypothetical protein
MVNMSFGERHKAKQDFTYQDGLTRQDPYPLSAGRRRSSLVKSRRILKGWICCVGNRKFLFTTGHQLAFHYFQLAFDARFVRLIGTDAPKFEEKSYCS